MSDGGVRRCRYGRLGAERNPETGRVDHRQIISAVADGETVRLASANRLETGGEGGGFALTAKNWRAHGAG